MKVKCEACNEIFEMGSNYKTQNLGKGIIRTYFECPGCHKEYTGYYTNEKIRYNQEKIRRLAEKAKKLTGEKALKINDEIEQLTKTNKEQMSKIRKELEGGE